MEDSLENIYLAHSWILWLICFLQAGQSIIWSKLPRIAKILLHRYIHSPYKPLFMEIVLLSKEVDLICFTSHYMKSVHIWIFSGLYFPAIGLNTDRFFVMQECRKIRTRKISNMYTFHAALLNPFFLLFSHFMYDAEKWPNKPQDFSKYVRPIFILFESVDWEGMNFRMPFTLI